MTTKKATTRRSAKSPQKPRKTSAPDPTHGSISKAEIRPLVIEARYAYDFQCKIGNVPDSMTFEDWRRAEVLALTGRAGLSKLDGGKNGHFRKVLEHFQSKSDRDAAAFETSMKTGKVKDHGDKDDTHENRAVTAHLIRQELAFHLHLATTSVEQLTAEARAEHELYQPDLPWEMAGPAHRSLAKLLTRKAAIMRAGKAIEAGYVVYLARKKSGTLTKLDDLEARLTVKELTDLLSTVRNRIALREERGDATARNKTRRIKAAAAKKRHEDQMDRHGASYDRHTGDPF